MPKVNVVANCYTFCQHEQKPRESSLQYIAALRELIVTCEFGNMADEMIRDQCIEKNTNVSHKTMLASRTTLEKANQMRQLQQKKRQKERKYHIVTYRIYY